MVSTAEQRPRAAPAEADDADADDLFTGGEPLTPTMRALLQIASCLESHSPIPIILLIAPLPPHAGPGAPEALVALGLGGWLVAPSLTTAQFTPKGRALLDATPPRSRHSAQSSRHSAACWGSLCASATRQPCAWLSRTC